MSVSVVSALLISSVESKTAPHILTTEELKVAVPGHSIGRADVLPHESQVEQFRMDGTYLMLGDNFQDPGKYILRDNMICIQSVSYKTMCRFLLVDQHGYYWLVRDLTKKSYRKVVISKH